MRPHERIFLAYSAAVALTLLTATAPLGAAVQAIPSSPGSIEEFRAVPSGTPTFNWSPADGAIGYELMVVSLIMAFTMACERSLARVGRSTFSQVSVLKS